MKELDKSINALKNGASIKVTNKELFAADLVKAGITKGPQSSALLLDLVQKIEAQLAAEAAALAAKKQLEPEGKFSGTEEIERLYQEVANERGGRRGPAVEQLQRRPGRALAGIRSAGEGGSIVVAPPSSC